MSFEFVYARDSNCSIQLFSSTVEEVDSFDSFLSGEDEGDDSLTYSISLLDISMSLTLLVISVESTCWISEKVVYSDD